MPTPTDDRPDLVTVFAWMRAAPGKEDELRRWLESVVEPTTNEAGCVSYDLHESREDPGAFFFYENWESAEQLHAHRETPHMAAFAAVLDDLLDESGLSVHRVRRIA
jgi:quinol monooxygenase YgiN